MKEHRMKIILQSAFVAVILAAILTTGFQCASAELTSAKLYIQRKDFQNAMKQLEKEVEKNPKSEEGYYLLGQVRLELRDYQGMKEAFDNALSVGPLHQKEIQSIKLSVWGRLFNDGVEAINKASDSSANVDKAISLFTMATIVMPESVMTSRNLGLAYYRKEDIPNAIVNLTIAFEKGKDLLACKLLGRIYLDRGNEMRTKFTEAHREVFASIKSLESLREKMKAIDVKYLLGNPSEVSKPAKAKKGDAREEWKYTQYNLIVSVDGEIVTALKYSTPYTPKIDSANYKASLVEFNAAVDVMKKGLAMFPEDAEISENLMNAYIGALRNDEARVLLGERVRKYPESKFDHYNLGVFLLKDSSFAEAIEQFKNALVIDTAFSAAVYNIAATYVNWGVADQEKSKAAGKEGDVSYKERYKLALPYLEKIVQEKKDDIQMWELLGQVYANLNMQDKALQAYDKADAIRKGKN